MIYAVSFVFQKLEQMGSILSCAVLSQNVRPPFLVLLLRDDDRFYRGKGTLAPPPFCNLLVRSEFIKR